MTTEDIVDKYDLKDSSEVIIGSITDENSLKICVVSYSLDDALPYPIYTAKSTYMINGEEWSVPEVRVFYEKIPLFLINIVRIRGLVESSITFPLHY